MALSELDIKRQTENVIFYLLCDDDDGLRCRGFEQECDDTVTDGPGDDFDPVLIADKLRSIGDALNKDVAFNKALTGLQKEIAQEAMDTMFSRTVEALCESHSAKASDVAPELQVIKASVALGLYIKKSVPETKSKVQSAMASFLTNRVGGWIAQQGGWDKVQGL